MVVIIFKRILFCINTLKKNEKKISSLSLISRNKGITKCSVAKNINSQIHKKQNMSPIKFLYLIIASTLRISDILSRNIEKTYANNCLHPSITQDGFYYINPDQNDPILVYCENGWTIVFNKIDYKGPSNVNYNKDFFAKPWTEYLGGFGSPDANFWIGLKRIRSLVQNEEMKMRIEANLLVNKKKPLYSIEYESFYVDSDSNQFRLKVGKKVSGNLIDDFKSMNGYKENSSKSFVLK